MVPSCSHNCDNHKRRARRGVPTATTGTWTIIRPRSFDTIYRRWPSGVALANWSTQPVRTPSSHWFSTYFTFAFRRSTVPEDFEHLSGITGPPPSHVLVLTHARLAVPELVGDCPGC